MLSLMKSSVFLKLQGRLNHLSQLPGLEDGASAQPPDLALNLCEVPIPWLCLLAQLVQVEKNVCGVCRQQKKTSQVEVKITCIQTREYELRSHWIKYVFLDAAIENQGKQTFPQPPEDISKYLPTSLKPPMFKH